MNQNCDPTIQTQRVQDLVKKWSPQNTLTMNENFGSKKEINLSELITPDGWKSLPQMKGAVRFSLNIHFLPNNGFSLNRVFSHSSSRTSTRIHLVTECACKRSSHYRLNRTLFARHHMTIHTKSDLQLDPSSAPNRNWTRPRPETNRGPTSNSIQTRAGIRSEPGH